MNELLNSPTLDAFWTCVVLAMASASISISITQTELFAPFREWTNKLHPMIGYLFRCFYCISHWVVIAGTLVYSPVLISSGFSVIDWVVSTFFTITLTSFFCGLMFRVFLAGMQKKITEYESKKAMSTE